MRRFLLLFLIASLGYGVELGSATSGGPAGTTGATGAAGADAISFGSASTKYYLCENFPGTLMTTGNIGAYGWTTVGTSGTGAVTYGHGGGGGTDANHPTSVKLSSGNTRAGIMLGGDGGGTSTSFKLGSGRVRWFMCYKLPTLTAAANRKFQCGLSNAAGGGGNLPTVGAFLEYDPNVTDDVRIVTMQVTGGAHTTRTVLNATPNTNWNSVMVDINAAGTSALIYHNGVLVGSPITADLDTTELTVPWACLHSTASQVAYVTGFELQVDFTTPR